MTWNSILTQLRDVLMTLYDDSATARAVAETAGININFIEFSSKPINNWQAILREAEKQGRTGNLINIAVGHYPSNIKLQAARNAYVQSQIAETHQPAVPIVTTIEVKEMNFMQKGELADALLKTPTMSNRNRRETVITALPDDIKNSIQRGPTDRDDVINIVTAALEYPSGLSSLIDVMHYFERGSLSMQAVDRVIVEISNSK
jgi:hypothetical protein